MQRFEHFGSLSDVVSACRCGSWGVLSCDRTVWSIYRVFRGLVLKGLCGFWNRYRPSTKVVSDWRFSICTGGNHWHFYLWPIHTIKNFPTRRSTSLLSVAGRCAIKPRSAGQLYVRSLASGCPKCLGRLWVGTSLRPSTPPQSNAIIIEPGGSRPETAARRFDTTAIGTTTVL